MRISDWSSDVCSSDLVRAEKPDVAIIATGGLPNTSFLPDGEDLVVTTWDILSGAAKPADDVLLFDDNGAHPGMTAPEANPLAGARLEIATPERPPAPDAGEIGRGSWRESGCTCE